jgi:hypothetical protein
MFFSNLVCRDPKYLEYVYIFNLRNSQLSSELLVGTFSLANVTCIDLASSALILHFLATSECRRDVLVNTGTLLYDCYESQE